MESNIITQFQKCNLTPELMKGLAKMNFHTPSPVQEAAIGGSVQFALNKL